MIVIGKAEELVLTIKSVEDLVAITEEEYFDFQNLIREACGDKPVKPPELPNPDEDPRITAMKEKARRRDNQSQAEKSWWNFVTNMLSCNLLYGNRYNST
jgi:hypothetical protein